MKTEVKFSSLTTATLYTGEDVRFPRKSPLLELTTYENAEEGLGGYGAPDSILIQGEEALSKLADLLARRHDK